MAKEQQESPSHAPIEFQINWKWEDVTEYKKVTVTALTPTGLQQQVYSHVNKLQYYTHEWILVWWVEDGKKNTNIKRALLNKSHVLSVQIEPMYE
jgi:hypothetical protein